MSETVLASNHAFWQLTLSTILTGSITGTGFSHDSSLWLSTLCLYATDCGLIRMASVSSTEITGLSYNPLSELSDPECGSVFRNQSIAGVCTGMAVARYGALLRALTSTYDTRD